MTYSEIIAARKVNIGTRINMAFRHSGNKQHIFIPQFPVETDLIGLSEGRLEQKYVLKLVGKYEGGHLFRAGFEQRVFNFKTFWLCDENCDSNYTKGDAEIEVQLFYEFLRGNVETQESAESIPDPRLMLAFEVPGDFEKNIYKPFGGPPMAPLKPFGSPTQKPFAPVTTFSADWFADQFIYEPGSFKIEMRYGKYALLEVSFSLKQFPVNTIVN